MILSQAENLDKNNSKAQDKGKKDAADQKVDEEGKKDKKSDSKDDILQSVKQSARVDNKSELCQATVYSVSGSALADLTLEEAKERLETLYKTPKEKRSKKRKEFIKILKNRIHQEEKGNQAAIDDGDATLGKRKHNPESIDDINEQINMVNRIKSLEAEVARLSSNKAQSEDFLDGHADNLLSNKEEASQGPEKDTAGYVVTKSEAKGDTRHLIIAQQKDGNPDACTLGEPNQCTSEVHNFVKIVEKRKRTVTFNEYRVRWEGYGPEDDTYEPENHFNKNVLEDAIELMERDKKNQKERQNKRKTG